MTPPRVTLFLVVALAVLATLSPAPADAFDLESRVVEHRLDNGMLFLLVRRPQAPVFTGYIRFRVGGVDEAASQSGLAHLFEHMAFKGTTRVGTRDYRAEEPVLARMDEVGEALASLLVLGDDLSPAQAKERQGLTEKMSALRKELDPLVVKDELSRLYLRNGAVGLNATTSKDLTSYFLSLPGNRVELWAILEASRMADPVMREFWSEKDVVMEERRMRVESHPFGKLYEAFAATAFGKSDPYGLPTLGTWEELRSLTASQARVFHQRHYQPANAVGALVGDLDIEATKALLEATFGAIPSDPRPTALVPAFALGQGERRVDVPFDAEPAVLVGFHKPNAPHRDDYVFDVVTGLLTGGQTSRLQKALVREKGVVSAVGAFGAPGNRRPNLFVIRLVPRHPHTAAQAEAALYETLAELSTKPVGAAELDKVRTGMEADFLRGLATNEGLASQLTYFQAAVGDWRYVVEHPKVLKTITADDVARVARTYFVPSNRVVATLVKTP